MSLIQIQNLTFAYDGSYDTIFEDVSFQIDTDWKLGFTGRNGRGKTTFLDLLMERYEYQGRISASVAFDYFPFPVKDPAAGTLAVVRTITPDCQDWELRRELGILEVTEDVLDRPFITLSNGEQTKVLLAALFLKRNHFLLIDEPTNHLDSHAREILSRYLNSKSGFILVSHDRNFLDGCIDHILSINKTNIEVQKGNFSSWWENKQRTDQSELAENARLKKDISRLAEGARRSAQWSDKVEKTKKQAADSGFVSHKAAKMMQRSKSMQKRQEKAIGAKAKLLKNIETAEELSLRPLTHYAGRLAELRNVSVVYGEKTVCSGVSFSISSGERTALCGPNGSGKSSLLKLLNQNLIPYRGELQTAPNLIISYVPQDTSFLAGSLSDFIVENDLPENLFKAILRKLDFSREQFDKRLEDFSEGQKKKTLIARSLCESAHLYIWDEPLNFIDVFSRMQIQELILRCQPTLLFVEHDSAFVEEIATGRVELTP